MAKVQFVETLAFPVEVLLPLRLIIFNGNVRRKLITGKETTLPQPLAEWLAKSSTLSGKVTLSPIESEKS